MAERDGLMLAQLVHEPYVDVSETHSAVVFFAGDRAYKLKKPVNLGFLDFSTPEARAAACRREAELNRRFAPDVYLGVMEYATRLAGYAITWWRCAGCRPAGGSLPSSRHASPSAPRSARSRGYSQPSMRRRRADPPSASRAGARLR